MFSIYATMLELDMGTFQPTGYDYIIHALGEEASNRYVQQFCELRPAFVQTLDPNACAWEGWVSRENWTFYRELLARYRPVKEAGFWRLWERLPDGQSGILDAQVQVSIKEESENAVRIVLTSEHKEPCTVDLSLTYTTHIPSLWQRLQTWNRTVCVEEENLSLSSGGQYTHYYLPAEAQKKPVGVAMVDGRAEIVLRSQPNAYTEISVQEVRVNGVLQKIV